MRRGADIWTDDDIEDHILSKFAEMKRQSSWLFLVFGFIIFLSTALAACKLSFQPLVYPEISQ
jgi:hypothetical protein